MELGFLSTIIFGFVLGIKHAIEPDHVIAVSTIASKSKKLWYSSLAGVFWGIGHTITLFVIGMIFILLKGEIPNTLAMSLEFLVGIMLVYLGIASILSLRKIHSHVHVHGNESHEHFHSHEQTEGHKHQHKERSFLMSLLVGAVHGLAGSAAMILLTMSTVQSVWEGAIYILIFGVGTVVGMLLSTTIIGIPFVLSSNAGGINKKLIGLTGTISTIFGVYYMYNLGITEGLFKLWV